MSDRWALQGVLLGVAALKQGGQEFLPSAFFPSEIPFLAVAACLRGSVGRRTLRVPHVLPCFQFGFWTYSKEHGVPLPSCRQQGPVGRVVQCGAAVRRPLPRVRFASCFPTNAGLQRRLQVWVFCIPCFVSVPLSG